MKITPRVLLSTIVVVTGGLAVPALVASPAPPVLNDWTVVGWNDLGMHCMDSDYSVFSILPPFNNLCAQVVDDHGDLVDVPAGTTMTYRAISDPTGSITTTSAGKTNFWQHVLSLFGVGLAVDQGLAGNPMPGASNTPRPMTFVAAQKWFRAEGIPIAPTDDAGKPQSYPLMRVEVRDASGVVRGSTDVVLPVSSEMDCRACHASGAGAEARPAAGWVADPDLERDFRLNILRLHDEMQATDAQYSQALAHFGYRRSGLFDTVTLDQRSILCASCHGTNALGSTGFGTIAPLTRAIHAGHADVTDPVTHMTLGSSDDRSSCYRCHPGSETRCLRGAMGSAVAADGTMSMQCQSCHGDLAQVGDPARQGWFDEPTCQSCHTGSATQNNGQIRYETVFEPSGAEPVAVSQLFATNPNTPAPGLDLYRFSSGHGGLQCSACHGSTHAEFPSSHANDNLQSIALQGHAGLVVECTACHDSMPDTFSGGPHGMHPIGSAWAHDHGDAVEHGGGLAQCRACHGGDLRGTVLSRSQGDRTFSTDFGTKHFWNGYEIGCYDCHNGPTSENVNPNHPPVVVDASTSTPAGVPVAITLGATDADGHATTLRIVSQAQHGTVSLAGTLATYRPYPEFAGDDEFTYAASDGQSQSQLGTVRIGVTANWENFGEGVAGTFGVPELTLGGPPRLGASVPLHLGNSAGITTSVVVMVGSRTAYQPTPFGGVVLVAQPAQRVLQVGPAGFHRPYHVTSEPSAIGRNLILQTRVVDAGAPAGHAFSRGLRMVFGL